MRQSSNMACKYEPKYLERLATVYIEKYEQGSPKEAKEWFHSFLPADLKQLVKPVISRILATRPLGDGGKD